MMFVKLQTWESFNKREIQNWGIFLHASKEDLNKLGKEVHKADIDLRLAYIGKSTGGVRLSTCKAGQL